MAVDDAAAAPQEADLPQDDRPLWRTLRFTLCEHGPGDLVRLRRPPWIRMLVPSRRLYQCPHCGARVLYAR